MQHAAVELCRSRRVRAGVPRSTSCLCAGLPTLGGSDMAGGWARTWLQAWGCDVVHCHPPLSVDAIFRFRCVCDRQRSFALGIQWIVVRTLGTVHCVVEWYSCTVCSLHKGTHHLSPHLPGVRPRWPLPRERRTPFPNSPLEGPMVIDLPRGWLLLSTKGIRGPPRREL